MPNTTKARCPDRSGGRARKCRCLTDPPAPQAHTARRELSLEETEEQLYEHRQHPHQDGATEQLHMVLSGKAIDDVPPEQRHYELYGVPV